MHITQLLNSLPCVVITGIDSDLNALTIKAYPFLTHAQVCHQIERLSGHIGGMVQDLRRAIIGYTLYTRQIDSIQDTVSKEFCRSSCDRPPVGCCNAPHCEIFTPSDYIIYRQTSLSMQLAHAISGLQKIENKQAKVPKSKYHGKYCPYLTDNGCTLKLFKSPRCAHYICNSLMDNISVQYGPNSANFLQAMTETSCRAISCCADFTNPGVLNAARMMLF